MSFVEYKKNTVMSWPIHEILVQYCISTCCIEITLTCPTSGIIGLLVNHIAVIAESDLHGIELEIYLRDENYVIYFVMKI